MKPTSGLWVKQHQKILLLLILLLVIIVLSIFVGRYPKPFWMPIQVLMEDSMAQRLVWLLRLTAHSNRGITGSYPGSLWYSPANDFSQPDCGARISWGFTRSSFWSCGSDLVVGWWKTDGRTIGVDICVAGIGRVIYSGTHN